MQLKAFPIVIGMLVVMFTYNLGHHVLPATWSFWAIEKFSWSSREIGWSLTYVGVGMVLVQGFLIRTVIPITGLRWAGVLGFIFTIAAFTCYALAPNALIAYVGLTVGALGALASPASSGIASNQVGPAQQGELQK